MTIEELQTIDLTGKVTAVIGLPASGKSYIAKLLAKKWNISLLSTDDFITCDFESDLYSVMALLQSCTTPLILEGVLGYRALRKGNESGAFKPDLIIECEISPWLQQKIYREQRPEKDYNAVRKMNKGLQSILNEYVFNVEDKPEHIILNNDWI